MLNSHLLTSYIVCIGFLLFVFLQSNHCPRVKISLGCPETSNTLYMLERAKCGIYHTSVRPPPSGGSCPSVLTNLGCPSCPQTSWIHNRQTHGTVRVKATSNSAQLSQSLPLKDRILAKMENPLLPSVTFLGWTRQRTYYDSIWSPIGFLR